MLDVLKFEPMRTTLTIDDDVLLAAKAIADQEQKSLGQVVSALARKSLRRPQSLAVRNGVPLLPVGNPQAVVTLDVVNALRDELP
jgi:hypothetical protein